MALKNYGEAADLFGEATDVEMASLDELKKQPVSDPEKFIRCDWCGMEMLKGDGTICDDCCPF